MTTEVTPDGLIAALAQAAGDSDLAERHREMLTRTEMPLGHGGAPVPLVRRELIDAGLDAYVGGCYDLAWREVFEGGWVLQYLFTAVGRRIHCGIVAAVPPDTSDGGDNV